MNGKFVRADSIKVNDTLLTFDNKSDTVYKIEYIDSPLDVYDISIEGNHNYFADDYLVHNKCGKYKGDDQAEQQRVDADKAAWEATLKVMEEADDRVRVAIDASETQFGIARERYDVASGELGRESRAQVQQAESIIGKSGLISGVGERSLEDVYGGIAASGKEASLGMQSTQTNLESDVLAAIAASEETKATLYANYVNNMASSYSDIPTPPPGGATYSMGSGSENYKSGGTGGEFGSSPGAEGGIFGSSEFGKFFGSFGMGSCFSGDTMINTINSTKEINRLNIGDTVKTYNYMQQKIEENKVTDIMAHNVDKIMIINDKIKVTGNHLMFVGV